MAEAVQFCVTDDPETGGQQPPKQEDNSPPGVDIGRDRVDAEGSAVMDLLHSMQEARGIHLESRLSQEEGQLQPAASVDTGQHHDETRHDDPAAPAAHAAPGSPTGGAVLV